MLRVPTSIYLKLVGSHTIISISNNIDVFSARPTRYGAGTVTTYGEAKRAGAANAEAAGGRAAVEVGRDRVRVHFADKKFASSRAEYDNAAVRVFARYPAPAV